MTFDLDKPAIVHCHASEVMHYVRKSSETSALCRRDVTGMTMIPHHLFGHVTKEEEQEYEWCERCLNRLALIDSGRDEEWNEKAAARQREYRLRKSREYRARKNGTSTGRRKRRAVTTAGAVE